MSLRHQILFARPERNFPLTLCRQWLKAETTKLGLSPAQVSEYLLLSAKTGEGFTQLKSTLKQITARCVQKPWLAVTTSRVHNRHGSHKTCLLQ